MKPFKIAGISFMPELWKPKQNLAQLLEFIDEAAEAGAQVVATPEGILDGYISLDLPKDRIREIDSGTEGFAERVARFRKRQQALARTIRDTCIPRLRDKAAEHKIYLFANTLDIRRGRSVYNTTFVIDPTGNIVGKYDKIHAGFEVVNTLGSGYPVFDTPYAPIGVLICADRLFPEAARMVALNGARVLVVNALGIFGQGENERFIRQRAYENGYYVLFCHPNETVLVSPEGRIIAATCAWENVVVRTIDPSESIGRGLFGNAHMADTYRIEGARAQYRKRYRDNRKRQAAERFQMQGHPDRTTDMIYDAEFRWHHFTAD